MRDKPLTLNVLWEIAYNIHKESLHLDSLEDFNATEADIMHMKEDILAMWKSRDMQGKLHPSDPCSSPLQTPGVGDLPWGKLLFPESLHHPVSVPRGPGGGGDMIAMSSSVFKPLAPPPRIPIAPGLSHYLQDPLPASFPVMGLPAEYNFDPIMGQPLRASTPGVFSQCLPSHGMSHSQPPLACESRVCRTCWGQV